MAEKVFLVVVIVKERNFQKKKCYHHQFVVGILMLTVEHKRSHYQYLVVAEKDGDVEAVLQLVFFVVSQNSCFCAQWTTS